MKNLKLISWFALAMMIHSIVPSFAFAQDSKKDDYLPSVVSVEVKGNVNVSDMVILSKVKIRKDQTLSRELINQDLKRLFGTGYFKDVKVDLVPQGRDFRVVLIVDEKPVIITIDIKGNENLKTRTLLKEIGLAPGQTLDQRILKEGIQNIEARYRKKGFRFIFVEDKVTINEGAKEATIEITINEGKRFKIKEITFKGNKSFKTKKLRKIMRTKKDGIIASGAFNENYFEDDIDRLHLFYQREGFLDAVIEPTVNYDNKENKIFIEMIVDEGKQYLAGEIKFAGNVQFPKMEIWEKLQMQPGKVYSPNRLSEDLNNIRKYFFEKGHINASVEPELKFNEKNGRVDITYTIQAGEVFYIDKIRIRGNTKTKDIVIRRELRVYPGEKFNGKRLDKSIQRLKDLNFFQEVTYETEPGSASNKRDVIFKVIEKQTGEFSFGGGVSSLEAFLGFVELSQANFDLMNWPAFTGDGQHLSIQGRWGSISRDVDISFVEPYLFDKPYSLALQGYNYNESVSNLDFDTQRTGGSVTVGKQITDELSTGVTYNFEHVELDEISSDAGADVLATDPSANLSKLKLTVSYDKRNSRIFPTKGYLTSFQTEVAGSFLGGSEDYYSFVARLNYYWTVWKKHLLELKAKLGVIDDFSSSSQVPVYDRFYAGGLGSVRGFKFRDIGPQQGGNPVGGETVALLSLEYTFPLIDNFKGAFFIDTGLIDADAYQFFALDDFAVSAGPGLLINTPLGPMVFYYGFPLANREGNESGRFEFSFKRGF